MGRTILGAIAGVAVVIATVAAAEPYGQMKRSAETTSTTNSGADLVVVSTPVGEKCLMLTVVDRRQQVVCVYHIETETGKISLKSVRDIQWDMKITQLNNEAPLPQEIRSLLEQR